jgi:hypothetical protein
MSVERTEWGVMTTHAVNHPRTLPKNRIKDGQVDLCDSREDAEYLLDTRQRFARGKYALVTRTTTIITTDWQEVAP